MFGVAMGGIWGLATSTALENVPVETRGFLSGILQQGYAAGYLIAGTPISHLEGALYLIYSLAAIVNITIVPHSSHTWRTLLWCSACMSSSAAVIRACLPESEVFLRARAQKAQKGGARGTTSKTRLFLREVKTMLKEHWMLSLYAVLLMTGTYALHLFYPPSSSHIVP